MSEPSCAFILHLIAKPGERDALLAKVGPFFDALAKDPRFVRAHVHEAADDPHLLVVYEAWGMAADEFMAHHRASEAVAEHNPKLEPHVAGREMRWLNGPAAWTFVR